MYVRWKKQKRRKKVDGTYFLESGNTHPQYEYGKKEDCLLIAYLVENVRVDGKPRQKILAYLGSIHDTKIMNLTANEKFWESVHPRLKALHLKSDQRKDIEQKLQRRIPKPNQEFQKMADLLAHHHPRARGTGKEREQLKAFRERHHLPGDDIR